MRKTLFFVMIAALISLGMVSLYESMQAQSARIKLMQTLSTQLGSINPAELEGPCELQSISQTWQQLQQNSASIHGQFAFVLKDSAAKDALSNLQATLRQAPSCSTLRKQWQTLEASCDQCHRAVRGGLPASRTRVVPSANTPAAKIP